MNTDEDKLREAREVAVFIAKGLTPKEVASKVDLPHSYVIELTNLPEFEDAVVHVGGEVALERWREYKLDSSASVDLRTRVRTRLNEYFDILDEIAMNPRTKPETRFAVIKELLSQAKIADEETAPPIADFPPSFFSALTEAAIEEDYWRAKRVQ